LTALLVRRAGLRVTARGMLIVKRSGDRHGHGAAAAAVEAPPPCKYIGPPV